MTTKPKQQHKEFQTGAVLVISLIMLLLLTIIGISGMQSTTLEEKMAGNSRDRNLAFQAAEAALRDAEKDILSTSATPRISGFTNFNADCGASTTSDTTDDGLCYSGPAGYSTANPIWDTVDWDQDEPTVGYADNTDADPIPRVSAQPRYIIEAISAPVGGFACQHTDGQFCYRITARAQGANPNTVVWLQSVFRPKNL